MKALENDKRLEYFKKHIKEKLESVKDDIPDRRYRLWIAAIDDCEDYDELREMAELDMQLDMFEYTRNEINPKLQRLNLEMDEIRGAIHRVKNPQRPAKIPVKALLLLGKKSHIRKKSAEVLLQKSLYRCIDSGHIIQRRLFPNVPGKTSIFHKSCRFPDDRRN